MSTGFSAGLSAGVSTALDGLILQHEPNGGSKIANAARDFEALLITQVLRSVHDEGGWLGTGDDDAGEAAVALGEEQLARTMAASGGIGLSRLIESGIRNEQANEKADENPDRSEPGK